MTVRATISEIGAANKTPLIPMPAFLFSSTAGRSNAKGVKQRISRTRDAIIAFKDLPMDWKNTAVIFTWQVIIVRER